MTLRLGARMVFEVRRGADASVRETRRLVHTVRVTGGVLAFPRTSVTCRRGPSLRVVPCPVGAEITVAHFAWDMEVTFDHLWVSSSRTVFQYDARTGRKIRAIEIPRPLFQGVADGRPIVAADDQVVALSPDTGRTTTLLSGGPCDRGPQVVESDPRFDVAVGPAALYVSCPDSVAQADVGTGAPRGPAAEGCVRSVAENQIAVSGPFVVIRCQVNEEHLGGSRAFAIAPGMERRQLPGSVRR